MSWGLPLGTQTSLTQQLDAAANAFINNQSTAAVNILNAFINHVNALRGSGKLTAHQAKELITSAQSIIFAIN